MTDYSAGFTQSLMSHGDFENISKLPIDMNIWSFEVKSIGGGSLRRVRDHRKKILSTSNDESSFQLPPISALNAEHDFSVGIQDISGVLSAIEFQLKCSNQAVITRACLQSISSRPRQPIAIIDRESEIDPETEAQIPFPVIPTEACLCTIRPKALIRCCSGCYHHYYVDYMVVCDLCNFFFYCSQVCREKDRLRHLQDCNVLVEYQPLLTEVLDSPFQFVVVRSLLLDAAWSDFFCVPNDWMYFQDTTLEQFSPSVLRDFLRHCGIYRLGMWLREAPACASCPTPPPFGELNSLSDPYVLPMEG